MYPLYQTQEDLLAGLRPIALGAADLLRNWDTGRPETLPFSQAAASLQLLESADTTHRKPPFGLARSAWPVGQPWCGRKRCSPRPSARSDVLPRM